MALFNPAICVNEIDVFICCKNNIDAFIHIYNKTAFNNMTN